MPVCYSIENSVDDKKWDDFVFNHPNGNIFQTRYMYEIYKRTKHYHPIKLFAINRATNQLSGILSAVIIEEIGGIARSFSKHSIVQGGPLVLPGMEKEVVPLLLAEYDKIAQKKALYSEIRNMFDVQIVIQNSNRYIYEDHLNFLINLDQTEQDLWHQLRYSRRKNINRALKENVTIEQLYDERQLATFYNLVEQTYKRVGIPLSHVSLLESAYDILQPVNMIRFDLAKHENKYIGALVCLLYKDTVYAWYTGMAQGSSNLQATSLMIWNVLKWGSGNRYRIFDFVGAGKPQIKYGPRDYKSEFGGQLVSYGRYTKVYSPMKMEIAKRGFEIYRNLLMRREI